MGEIREPMVERLGISEQQSFTSRGKLCIYISAAQLHPSL